MFAYPGTPGAGPDTEGIEELEVAFRRFHDAFPDLHIVLDDVIAAGDRVEPLPLAHAAGGPRPAGP